jgi:quercetin dioxygenase-like cupin family protein
MNIRVPQMLAIVVMCSLCGLGLPGCQASRAWSPPGEVRMDDRLRQALDERLAHDREVIVSLVELPPHTTMDRHWHPGEEFHYYLEGKVTIAIDGQPPIVGTPGGVGYVPYQRLHTAITEDEGAKFLVFRVHTAGKPVRYLESERTPKD